MSNLQRSRLDDFLSYARNPKTWVMAARRNLAVAKLLFSMRDNYAQYSAMGFDERSGILYASYMHAGFAIESAVKAVLVHGDPTVVSNEGWIDKNKFGSGHGHGIRALTEQVLGNLESDQIRLLEKLEEHVVWVGRYTIPISAKPLLDDEKMDNLRNSSFNDLHRVELLFNRLLSMLPDKT